jgi:hypothetical protein
MKTIHRYYQLLNGYLVVESRDYVLVWEMNSSRCLYDVCCG